MKGYQRISSYFSLSQSQVYVRVLFSNRPQNIHNEKGFADSNGLSMSGPLFTELECSKGAEDLTKT